MSDTTRETFRKAVNMACACIPDGTYTSFSGDTIKVQAPDREAVKSIRNAFPPTFWKKRFDKYINDGTWSYSATFDGIDVLIYACKEAPPTCRLITEEYEAVEQVPIIAGYEAKTVTRTRTRVECDEPVHA